MRSAAFAFVLALGASGWSQTPDVRVQVNAVGSFFVPQDGTFQWRYYSVFGVPSVAALRFSLEPGFTAYISERLQRIPHDGDPDQLEQAYVEDEGIWRLGKQVLPFGTTTILRESAIAARGDFDLPIYGLPAAVAICDAGAGRQRGIAGRIGPNSYGFSFAAGEHFGISGTSLTEIRLPNDSPGDGQGWRYALGADITRRVGRLRLRAEGLALRSGVSALDPDVTLLDLSAVLTGATGETLTVGYTREFVGNTRFIRVVGALPVIDHLTLTPYIRFRNEKMWNMGIEFLLHL